MLPSCPPHMFTHSVPSKASHTTGISLPHCGHHTRYLLSVASACFACVVCYYLYLTTTSLCATFLHHNIISPSSRLALSPLSCSHASLLWYLVASNMHSLLNYIVISDASLFWCLWITDAFPHQCPVTTEPFLL